MAGWDDKLAEWREAGLLDDEQVAAIRAHEEARAGGVAVWQEALGYLGATLALSAGALLVGEFWEDLAVAAQLALVAVLAGALTVTGLVVPDDREDALRRLAGVLLAAGSLAAAWLGGIAADGVLHLEEARIAVLAGGAALVHGAVTWSLRRLPLPQVATYAGLWTTVVATMLSLQIEPGMLLGGLAVWTVGVVWAVLTWGGIVAPTLTGYLLGGATVGVGAQIASIGDARVAGLLLGLVSVVGVLAAGAWLGELVLLALGAGGILVFVPQLVFELFADTIGAPVALLVTGVLLVGAAVGSIRLGREVLEEDGASRRVSS